MPVAMIGRCPGSPICRMSGGRRARAVTNNLVSIVGKMATLFVPDQFLHSSSLLRRKAGVFGDANVAAIKQATAELQSKTSLLRL